MTDSEQWPELTVVVGSKDDPQVLFACLDALSRQEGGVTAEVVVVIEADEAAAEMIRNRYPQMTLVQLPSPQTIGRLRAAGLSLARGDIVALTEAHCLPALDWLVNLRRSHALHAAEAIGGSVENAVTERIAGWAAFAFEYGRFSPPLPDGSVAALPAANVSYKRAALTACRELWAQAFNEIVVHAAIRAAAGQIWTDPTLRVQHHDPGTLRRYMRERFYYSRWYAGERGRSMSSARRLFLLLALPLLPFVLFSRAARGWCGKQGPFWRTLPILFLAALVAATGEAVGAVAAAGDSAYHLR